MALELNNRLTQESAADHGTEAGMPLGGQTGADHGQGLLKLAFQGVRKGDSWHRESRSGGNL